MYNIRFLLKHPVEEKEPMSTLEERVQALEQEHADLKKTIELQTIAIGALVNKATLERLNEKYDKIFDVLINHDRLTNERLGGMQNQIIELDNKLDGKIVGLQTEMRQHFIETDGKVVELQVEMRQHFVETDGKVVELQVEMRQTQKQIDTRFEKVETHLDQMGTLLVQILERLPKNS
jgi:hypothetical protein